ncbi:nuclear transport factor 2 family protein [Streptomyces sp. NPDC098781]|uniref:nuclear transport factor 2 family protein n=1 Tax=Streptomyces sp. NPDC098781 TaxID=3366097 RepID=UPI00381334ED
MRDQDNKTICRQYIEAVGRGDDSAATALMADDFTHQLMGTSAFSGTRGREGVAELVRMLGTITVSGVAFTITCMTEEDGVVCVEASGRSELVAGGSYNNVYCFVFTLRDGKVAAMREYFDTKYIDEVLAAPAPVS